jgi:hypothetical protein
MRFSPVCLLAAALMMSVPSDAHHSLFATYVLDQQQVLRGTVKEFLVRNPHSFILLNAPDQQGQMQEWQIEWSPAGILSSQGIRKETLQPGDQLEITIAPGKDPLWHRGLVRIFRRPADGFEWGTKPGEVVPNWIALSRR